MTDPEHPIAGMTAVIRLLACLVLAGVIGAAERSAPAEDLLALQRIHAAELIDFAAGLDARDGSLEGEARAAALALAKKLDPQQKPKEALRKAMTPDEAAADKAAREAAVARAREREASEKVAGAAAAGYPPPVDPLERFEALRFEQLRAQVRFGESLSANPESRIEAPVRVAVGKSVTALLGIVRWSCDRVLKERAAALASSSYAPWSGTWATRLGFMSLVQSGEKVTGVWRGDAGEGSIAGTVKDRTLTGTWKSGGEQGQAVLVLSRTDDWFHGDTRGKAGEPLPIDGHRERETR